MKDKRIMELKDARKIHGLVCLKNQIEMLKASIQNIIRNSETKVLGKRLQLYIQSVTIKRLS